MKSHLSFILAFPAQHFILFWNSTLISLIPLFSLSLYILQPFSISCTEHLSSFLFLWKSSKSFSIPSRKFWPGSLCKMTASFVTGFFLLVWHCFVLPCQFSVSFYSSVFDSSSVACLQSNIGFCKSLTKYQKELVKFNEQELVKFPAICIVLWSSILGAQLSSRGFSRDGSRSMCWSNLT